MKERLYKNKRQTISSAYYQITNAKCSALKVYWQEAYKGLKPMDIPNSTILKEQELEKISLLEPPEFATFYLNDLIFYQEKPYRIIDINYLVDVEWQNKINSKNVLSRDLLTIEYTEDFEYFPKDFVCEIENGLIGIVGSVDASQSTVTVKWLSSNDNKVLFVSFCLINILVYFRA